MTANHFEYVYTRSRSIFKNAEIAVLDNLPSIICHPLYLAKKEIYA